MMLLDATNSRIRPIFMSTLTSVFGMLPLVVFPGAGSELYKVRVSYSWRSESSGINFVDSTSYA